MALQNALQRLGTPEQEDEQDQGTESTEVQLSVGYSGVVHRRKVERRSKEALSFEDKLRAEAVAARAEQFRAVPEGWMERSAENQFGSSAFVIDSDDDGADDDKDVAAEIHAIQSYGCE